MHTRGFHWITLATAVVAALGVASSLAIEAAHPGTGTMAGPAAHSLIALPSTSPQCSPNS